MSSPITDLRAFAGQITREQPILELRAGTWDAVAKVTPLRGGRGRDAHERQFEVSVAWHGPPMEGFARLPAGQAVDASDTMIVAELELAKALAMAAVDLIRAHEVPDLRTLQRTFERRR